MFKIQKEACRLCLSTDMHRSYYPLLDHEDIEQLKASFSLVSDLSDISIHPTCICDDCNNVSKRFIKLKKLAFENDVFLVKYQVQIRKNGIKDALENARVDTFEEHNENDSQNLFGTGIQNEVSNDTSLTVKLETKKDMECKFEVSALKEEEVDQNDDDIKPQVNKKGKQGYCLSCEKLFADLENHEKQFHKINVILEKCNTCDKTFGTKKLLRSHMQVYTSELVKCPKCVPDRFLKEYVLRKHLKNCHKMADIPCEYAGCKKMFKQKEVMNRHIKFVHMQERTLCSYCGAAVIDIYYHLQTCNKDNLEQVTCKICDKQFASKDSLSFHDKNIHGPLTAPAVCTICGKSVKDMRSHMKVNHSKDNQRTICCLAEGCESLFRTNQEVTAHYNKVHLDIKAQCTICLQWLKNLPEHVNQVHQQDRKHVCSQCGKQFFKSSDLKVHIERVHQGKRYICPECGKTVSKIRDHMKAVHGISEIDKSTINTVANNDVR